MYRIEYKRPARKALQRMPSDAAARFLRAFEALAEDPERRDLDITPMQGRPGFRLRIGQWRALYTLEHERLVILVVQVGARGDVYK
ncbi:addiction module toxin RelE [Thioalkalivibrio denitrificans]|uniref:Addiction module toxin RelE n=1 Tax=Thioalkalivibrio denitrificans TaxID=108003 RepID=A0A1V3ND94_9GAMM|nr:type II toxin-antitoxin system RelE/ParE family toxin [Thioalkalivibrio denitrificans]OOG22756.1 addiction module toxin RelE [Thioalkalivibrio denitrificans]